MSSRDIRATTEAGEPAQTLTPPAGPTDFAAPGRPARPTSARTTPTARRAAAQQYGFRLPEPAHA